MIPVRCTCGERYEVGDHLAGQEVRCEACDRKLVIGSASPQASFSGLSTMKFMNRTEQMDLTPDQIRRIAKRRSKEMPRQRFWSPTTVTATGSGLTGFLIAFFLFGLPGVTIWGFILLFIGGMTAFFKMMERRALAAELAED